jgi:hypothetical protein
LGGTYVGWGEAVGQWGGGAVGRWGRAGQAQARVVAGNARGGQRPSGRLWRGAHLDGRLVAGVAARAHQHGQEQRDHQVLPQQRLVAVQYKGAGALQDEQAQQPAAPAAGEGGRGPGVRPGVGCVWGGVGLWLGTAGTGTSSGTAARPPLLMPPPPCSWPAPTCSWPPPQRPCSPAPPPTPHCPSCTSQCLAALRGIGHSSAGRSRGSPATSEPRLDGPAQGLPPPLRPPGATASAGRLLGRARHVALHRAPARSSLAQGTRRAQQSLACIAQRLAPLLEAGLAERYGVCASRAGGVDGVWRRGRGRAWADRGRARCAGRSPLSMLCTSAL